VEFCAYAIPHPSEAKMNVRIQTYGEFHSHDIHLPAIDAITEGVTARQALEKGLRDVQDLCDIVTDKFLEALTEYTNKMSS
jgi:DNA-directed RNA polymerase I and III subunit RPAC2